MIDIEKMIDQGILRNGSLVPSDRELSKRLGASLATVQKAVNRLAGEGKLVRMPRKGTVVADKAGRSGGRSTWAVIVPTMEYFYPPVVHAIEEEARSLGTAITLGCNGDDPDLERELVLQAVVEGAQGVLLAPAGPETPRSRDTLEYLGDLPIPVVIMDHWGIELPLSGVDCVLSDNFAGAYQSTAHLIRHGYKKILLFGGDSPTGPENSDGKDRRRGYEAAMADHHLEISMGPLPAWNIDYRPEAVRKALDAGIEAFVLLEDHSASRLLNLLNHWGVRVPDQVAVIGYDDEPFDTLTNPPLSSVRVQKKEIGRRAAQLLHDRIINRHRGDHRTVSLRPTVVARESCGRNCPLEKETPRANSPAEMRTGVQGSV